MPWRSSMERFQSTHPARGATKRAPLAAQEHHYFNPRTPRGVRPTSAWPLTGPSIFQSTHPARGATAAFRWRNSPPGNFNPRTPRGVRPVARTQRPGPNVFQSTHPARGATLRNLDVDLLQGISIHAPREGCDQRAGASQTNGNDFNPRTPRGVRQQTLPKSREFAWLNLLICTRGRRLSIRKQTRLCSMKLSFMLFGCEPAGEGVSSWTSHATKSKVRLEGRSAYSQSVRSSAHSDFPGNKSGGCPVRDP